MDWDGFERYGFDVKGWARQTRYLYLTHGKRAERWLAQERHVALNAAAYTDVGAYHAQTSPTARNRNNTRQALIAVYDFLCHLRVRDDNPARSLPRMREPRPLPKGFTDEQARALMAAARAHGPMWHAYLSLLLFGGLRRDEARLLEWPCIEGDTKWIRYIAKGGQQRVQPLHRRAREALLLWRGQADCPRWIFTADCQSPVSQSTVYRHVRMIGETAGIEGLHPHACRHTFGTGLLESGADIRTVQEAMGHAALSSTQVYLRARPARVAEAVDALDW